ncbi:MAG: hypothetical protein ACR2QE_12340 [Acidimicrobiales bacterium]
MSIDQRLRNALDAGEDAFTDSSDLLERVRLTVADDRRLSGQRRRRIAVVACVVAAITSVAVATIDRQQGVLIMDWWILETVWFAVMVGLAVWLGPFIRRFGKSYAADVFRANPRTGKSFIVLMDIAYYLIFAAYILFTVQFEPATEWEETVNAAQMQVTAIRLGGILLIVGLLHGLNVLTLPVMGRIFTLNRQLDDETASVGGN